MQRLDPFPANSRTRTAIELVIVLAMAEIWIWNVYGAGRGLFPVLASVVIGFIVISAAIRRYHTAGEDRQHLWSSVQSWLIILVISSLLTLIVMAIGEILLLEGERFRFTRLERVFEADWLSKKLSVIIMQQVVLHLFLFPSFLDIVKYRWPARAMTAIVFGILHLPSLLLAGMTAFVAVVWSWYYERSRRLVPLVICHLVLAITVSSALSERLMYNLGVGDRAMERAERYGLVTQGPLANRFIELQSDAFYARSGGTDDGFVRELIREVLKRGASDEELKHWTRVLSDESRAAVVSYFLRIEQLQRLLCRQLGTCP